MSSIIKQAAGPIIKSDRVGRTRYTTQYKQEALDAFEASSLSAPAFAQQCGIKYPTFAAWLAGRNRGAGQTPPSQNSPAFILAEFATAEGEALEVHLPGGALARVAGAAQIRQLAELLRHLA